MRTSQQYTVFLLLVAVLCTFTGWVTADPPEQYVCSCPIIMGSEGPSAAPPTATATTPPSTTPGSTTTATPTEVASQTGEIMIDLSCSVIDAPGNDNDFLNDEYICLANPVDHAIDMTNWKLMDAVAHTFRFPNFVLAAGAQVLVHTGSGTDTTTDLYWGQSRAIWNNSGDSILLYDSEGHLVAQIEY